MYGYDEESKYGLKISRKDLHVKDIFLKLKGAITPKLKRVIKSHSIGAKKKIGVDSFNELHAIELSKK